MVDDALLRAIKDSVVMGASIGLMAAGLALTYSISKIANFAHGDYSTAAIFMYIFIAWLVFGEVKGDYLTLTENYVGFIVAPLAGALAALGSYILVFRPLKQRGSTPLQLMVASIGLELGLRAILYILYALLVGAIAVTPGTVNLFQVMGVNVKLVDLLAPMIVLVAVVGVHLLLTRTLIGVSMRALASNPTLAEAVGINTFRVESLTWVLGGLLAGLGGVLYFNFRPVATHPMETGWALLAFVFAAITLGGLGSFFGSLAASFIIAFAYNLISYFLIQVGLPSDLSFSVPLIVVILTLLFAPGGLASLWASYRARRPVG